MEFRKEKCSLLERKEGKAGDGGEHGIVQEEMTALRMNMIAIHI